MKMHRHFFSSSTSLRLESVAVPLDHIAPAHGTDVGPQHIQLCLRILCRVQELVGRQLLHSDTQKRLELKVELKLEKLDHGDVVVRVVGSHGESAGKRCLDTGGPKKFWREP